MKKDSRTNKNVILTPPLLLRGEPPAEHSDDLEIYWRRKYYAKIAEHNRTLEKLSNVRDALDEARRLVPSGATTSRALH